MDVLWCRSEVFCFGFAGGSEVEGSYCGLCSVGGLNYMASHVIMLA